jgi:cytochrome c biogenesis protein CcmG, thiol:disulfide interchange protein DsbE
MSGDDPDARGDLRRHLPRAITLVAVLLLLGLLAYGLTTQGSSQRIDQSLADGEAPLAPEFELSVLDEGALPEPLARRLRAELADGRLGLAELEGTPFVLNFWASWCNPCRDEAPILEQGWRRHSGRGVLYLGLNMQDVTDDALAFLDEFAITYPTIRDQDKDVATSYGATGIPETYFVSSQGRVVGHVVGVVSEQQLDEGASAARQGVLVGTESGGAQRPQR